MNLWLDAQLSPALASWLASTFSVRCTAVRELQLRDATDHEIFMSAREAGAVIVSKDADFVRLLEQFGPPPRVPIVYLHWAFHASSRVSNLPFTAISAAFCTPGTFKSSLPHHS